MSALPKFVEIEQNTPGWLEWRKGKIGASDLPIILGLSPYCSPYVLWKRKCGFMPEQQTNPAMQKGHMIEEKMRVEINEETSSDFKAVIVQHQELDWAVASLDGLDANKSIVWECKYNNKEKHSLALKNELREDHYAQMQWQLFVSGNETGWYTSCNDLDKITVEVEFDPNFITNTALPAATDFIKSLLNFNPPEMTDADMVEITDPAFEVLAHEWRMMKGEVSILKKKENKIREQLLSFTDDGNCTGFGLTMKRMKPSTPWKEMVETILEENPDLVDKYPQEKFIKVEIGGWKITISKEL